eukprot:scaffold3345_cov164-Ochromonas_danica.AAC.3
MIPSGYEDFVRTHEELLEAFRGYEEKENDQDRVSYAIYPVSQDLATQPLPTQLQRLEKLRKDILAFLSHDIESYLWNHEGFQLFLVIEEEGHHQLPCHLRGVSFYGNNIEDEWYLVYLLQKASQHFNDIAVSIEDSDGQFLLIEASDHIESWLLPENSKHRVWIMNGELHVVPLETPGKTINGVSITSALHCLASGQSSKANPASQRAINERSLSVYPAKVLAHRHHVSCLLPSWVAQILSMNSQLIADAINAFEETSTDEMSKAIAKVPLPWESGIPLQVCDASMRAVSVVMNRTLYAQLQFKKFKAPRRFHPYVRAVATAQSSKANQALDRGLRIACGLVLALREQLGNVSRRKELLKHSQEQMDALLSMGLSSELISHCVRLSPDNSEEELAELVRFSHVPCVLAFNSVSHKINPEDVQEETKSAIEAILKEQVASDSDAWMFLDPEQLDKEMADRMAQFSSEPLNETMVEEERTEVSQKDELQTLADSFRSFLNEESDFDGVRPLPMAQEKQKQSTPQTVHDVIDSIDLEKLDLNCVNDIVSKALLETDVNRSNECNNKTPACAEEVKDSDDESDDESDEERDDSEYDSEGDDFETRESNEHEIGSSEGESEEDGDDYEAEMDAEIFQEEALRATFEDLLALRSSDGRESSSLGDLDDDDMDMHLLLNILKSHAESLGVPQGPAHALFSQLGAHLPVPPPINQERYTKTKDSV